MTRSNLLPARLTALGVAVVLLAANASQAINILHYRVNATDLGQVNAGTVPSVDSPDGMTAFGPVQLSSALPTIGVPSDAGDQSLNFSNGGILAPGTQQLLNSAIEANGGFSYEAWVAYTGGGNVNSIIDYAGTEKLVRNVGASTIGYLNNSAGPQYPVADGTPNEWHYSAVVFTPTGPVDGNGAITGSLAFYEDSNAPHSSVSNVTISNFGDSLNRTIAVGAHPVGFGGDFFQGNIFEPRVMLGEVAGTDLLYQASGPQLIAPINYRVDVGSEFFSAQNLVNGSGLSDFATIDNLPSLTHAGSGAANAWVTDAFFPDYYTGGGAVPVMTFELDAEYDLTDLVAWNYSVPGNAARDVLLEFFTDDGTTFIDAVMVEIPQLAGPGHVIDLGGSFDADTVRVSFLTNWVGFGAGGDRVGLAELRFIGEAAGAGVPEPTTGMLLMLGAAGLAMRRKRRAA